MNRSPRDGQRRRSCSQIFRKGFLGVRGSEVLELENPDLFKWLNGEPHPMPEEVKGNEVRGEVVPGRRNPAFKDENP